MLARATALFARFVAACVPSPFVFALLLTAVAFLLGLAIGRPDAQSLPARAADLLSFWFGRDGSPGGFVASGGFAFALQMCLVLATGHALASAPPLARLLRRLASWPRTEPRAAALTTLVAMVAAWLNWGFGLVAAAVFAREVYRVARDRGERWNYPLLCAAAYSSMMVWHGGLSGSAPLAVAQSSHEFHAIYGTISTARTLFAPQNLALNGAFLVLLPCWFALLAARGRAGAQVLPAWPLPGDGAPLAEREAPRALGASPAERLDESRALGLGVVLLAGGSVALRVAERGLAGSISLATVIVAFLALGVLLHGTPRRYAAAFADAGGELSGILLQFPFYYGILGLLAESGVGRAFAESGTALVRALAEWGLPLDTAFSWVTFLSAALLNCFVPSGGGQWAIQGGIAGQSALDLGLDPARAVLAVAYGDEATNMIQPFWALALLSITGIKAREVLTYSALLLAVSLPLYLLAAALF